MFIKIYPEEPCLLPVQYSDNPLLVYNKNYADIEEVAMCFKKNASDSEDKYLVKYYKDGSGTGGVSGDVLIDIPNNTFTMVKTELDSVPINLKGYRMFIGVKVLGLTKMLWLRVDDQSKIVVEEDGIAI